MNFISVELLHLTVSEKGKKYYGIRGEREKWKVEFFVLFVAMFILQST